MAPWREASLVMAAAEMIVVLMLTVEALVVVVLVLSVTMPPGDHLLFVQLRHLKSRK